MFDSLVAATAGAHGAGAVDAWSRVESAACARRLAAMATMLDALYAAEGSASRDQWCLDNFDATAAHVAAAQRLTPGTAANQLLVAVALHERFPRVAAVFAEGLVGYSFMRTIVTRGALVIDPDALRALDTALAEALRSWEPMSVARTEHTIDAIIAGIDPYAVRRAETRARDRSVDVVVEDGSGMATVFATLFASDAKAFDARVSALAGTVCPADPRTKGQRRADAIGALTHGADRLACLCDSEQCPAALVPPSTGVVVYVIAHQDTLDGTGGPGGWDDAPQPNAPVHDPTPDAPPQSQADTEPVDDTAVDDTSDEAGPATTDRDHTSISESADLDGVPPRRFAQPLHQLTLTEALTPPPGHLACIRPAAMMGGQLLPGAIARRAAHGATLTPIVHPGLAPPEPRYRPSRKLADFVRCRDMTCRFPGCRIPATHCDVDHTIPWPYGPTAASNLKVVCRRHHLLKTFWGGESGWREQQLVDGTIAWTAPDGRRHVTTPGSRLLFPELSQPTATVLGAAVPAGHTAGLKMPRRTTTRAQDRANRIHTERQLNQAEFAEPVVRDAAQSASESDADPPPF